MNRACPRCLSPHHFLCGSEKVKLVTVAQGGDHILTEMGAGDLYVLLLSDLDVGAHVLPADQVALDAVIMHFNTASGSSQLIERVANDKCSGYILLIGCGKLECDDFALEVEATPPAVRAACHALDEALCMAQRLHCRRVFIEAHELVCVTGDFLAAALHCRVQLLQAQSQADCLQEVVLLAPGCDAERLAASARCPGPLCRDCPFAR